MSKIVDEQGSLPDSLTELVYLDNCPVCENRDTGKYIETSAQMHHVPETFSFDQCPVCRLVFLNPRVVQQGIHKYYGKYYLPYRGASAWGKYAGFVQSSQQKMDKARVKLVMNHRILNEQTLVLDVGCGQPTFLEACKAGSNCTAVGIDFSDEGWKDTGDRFKALDLRVMQVKDLSLFKRPDVITMWHYLEHDYDPVGTLSALRKLARPGTVLVIEVPNFDSESRKKYGRHWAGYHTPRHTFLFSPRNLKLLLRKTGWQTIELNTRGTLDSYITYWMSEMEKKGIDWQKDMAPEFWPFVYGMLRFRFKNLFAGQRSHGIMTVAAGVTREKRSGDR